MIKRAEAWGSGSAALGLALPKDRVAICAKNSVQWLLYDYGCVLQQFVSVPIATNIDEVLPSYLRKALFTFYRRVRRSV